MLEGNLGADNCPDLHSTQKNTGKQEEEDEKLRENNRATKPQHVRGVWGTRISRPTNPMTDVEIMGWDCSRAREKNETP